MGKLSNVGAARTPTEELTAQKDTTVHDASGRVIGLRKPSVLAQFDLIAAVGPENAKNEVWINMVLPILYIHAIDGVPVPQPTTLMEVRGLIQRLDEHGIRAVHEAVAAMVVPVDPEASKKKSGD